MLLCRRFFAIESLLLRFKVSKVRRVNGTAVLLTVTIIPKYIAVFLYTAHSFATMDIHYVSLSFSKNKGMATDKKQFLGMRKAV